MSHDVVLTETLIETLRTFETEDAERIINKPEEIKDFPSHYLARLKNHPGYKIRVGDLRVLDEPAKQVDVVLGDKVL